MDHYEYCLIPAAAAMALQLLGLVEVSKLEAARKPNFADWVYWLSYIVNPILAAFVGWIYFDQNSDQYGSVTAAAVGLSAPSILKSLIGVFGASQTIPQ